MMAALTLKETHPSLSGKEVILHDGCESISEEDSYCSCSGKAIAIGDVTEHTLDKQRVREAMIECAALKKYEDPMLLLAKRLNIKISPKELGL